MIKTFIIRKINCSKISIHHIVIVKNRIKHTHFQIYSKIIMYYKLIVRIHLSTFNSANCDLVF